MENSTILGLIIGVVVIVTLILLAMKKSKLKFKSPFMMRKERYANENSFYPNYKLSQEQAEKDVNCEYKGFLTRYF
jgi:uncharacterized protein YxeA